MTYRHRRLKPHEAAAAATTSDLVPWREAAALVQVKPATLARWIDRGHVPTANVEGRRYVSLADVSARERETRHRRTTAL